MLGGFVITMTFLGYFVQGGIIQNDDDLLDVTDRLRHIIGEKCLKNTNEAYHEEVLEALDYIKNDCWRKIYMNHFPGSDEEFSEHCLEHIPDVIDCLVEFTIKLEPCLESEETFLKQFIPKIYESSFSYFCDVDTKTISMLTQPDTGRCLRQFINNPETDPQKICYAESEIFGDYSTAEVITKQDLCHDLENIRFCYEEIFDAHCPDATDLKEFQLGIMTEGLTACQAEDEDEDESEGEETEEPTEYEETSEPDLFEFWL